MSHADDINAEIERRVVEGMELVRTVAKKFIGKPLDREQMSDAIADSLKGAFKTKREDDGTPIFDPLTCIYAITLREMGFTLGPEIPDVAWVPRESIEWNVRSVGATEAEREQNKMKVSIGPKFTEAFQWLEVDFAISPADDLKELDA